MIFFSWYHTTYEINILFFQKNVSISYAFIFLKRKTHTSKKHFAFFFSYLRFFFASLEKGRKREKRKKRNVSLHVTFEKLIQPRKTSRLSPELNRFLFRLTAQLTIPFLFNHHLSSRSFKIIHSIRVNLLVPLFQTRKKSLFEPDFNSFLFPSSLNLFRSTQLENKTLQSLASIAK